MVRTREQIEAELNEISEDIEKASDTVSKMWNMSDDEWEHLKQEMIKEGHQADEEWIACAKYACEHGGSVGNIDDPYNGIIGHLRREGVIQ